MPAIDPRTIRTSCAALAAVALLWPRSAMAAVIRPDHVVVVMMEDRYSNALGDATNLPYTNNTLARGALIYSNSHGLNTSAQQGEMNYLALYSGSTQGVTDDGTNYTFSGNNLAQQMNNAGFTFNSFAESLPSNGDTTTTQAAGSGITDLYTRDYNPAAMFSNVGTGKVNADVNKTFSAYQSLVAGGFANLPALSLIVPNNLDNSHGSNNGPPYATDPSEYNYLRQSADSWLQQNIDAYLQWAKTHNSLLIVTTDEGDRANNFAAGGTTLVNGDPRLFIPGYNSDYVNTYNLNATLQNMYGLTRIGDNPTIAGLDTNASGQLTVPEPASAGLLGMLSLGLLARRRRRTC